MGVAVASVTVVGAALLGGALRLLMYPQFVAGMVLLIGSVLLKLSRNVAGVVIVTVVALAVSLLLAVFNGKIIKLLKKSAPKAGQQAKAAAEFATAKASEGVAATPAYAYTLVGFVIPAVGQFLGSMATLRMLSSLDVSPKNLPGVGYTATFSVMYLLTLTTGLGKRWASPSKVSFVLQSMMVARAMATSSAKDLHLNEFLPSVMAGWGSLLLSLTPGAAMVSAAKAGAASAALAGAGVASFEGIRALAGFSAGKQRKRKSEDADVDADADEPERSRPDPKKSFQEMVKEWKNSFDEDALRAWATDNLSREALVGVLRKVLPADKNKNKSKNKRTSTSSGPEQEREQQEEELLEVSAADQGLDQDQNNHDEEEDEENDPQVAKDRAGLKQEVEENNIDVTVLAPPLKMALPLVLFRALPTCLTLGIGIALSLASLMRGRFKPSMLAIPVMLAPFALGEIVGLVRQVGLGVVLSGGLLNPRNQQKLADEYQDGMSLLLWQSPSMLKAWRSVSSVQNPEALLDDMAKAPGEWLRPDQEAVDAAPKLSYVMMGQLAASVVIDIIGMSSYAIPALGEMTDFIWAPMQAFMIQQMYQVPSLTYLGFFEEILPFTDILPSATIAWFYVYGEHLPAWAIRAKQTVLAKHSNRKRRKAAKAD